MQAPAPVQQAPPLVGGGGGGGSDRAAPAVGGGGGGRGRSTYCRRQWCGGSRHGRHRRHWNKRSWRSGGSGGSHTLRGRWRWHQCGSSSDCSTASVGAVVTVQGSSTQNLNEYSEKMQCGSSSDYSRCTSNLNDRYSKKTVVAVHTMVSFGLSPLVSVSLHQSLYMWQS